ncbi:probable basic-leucine zipper transcription factor S [Eurosta solidaginis]|uniref:probable basic-leucine zipper transcription factor S n=1 Tax=Eurosta solidaginis TaxID=178769 RepID=UPI0035312534
MVRQRPRKSVEELYASKFESNPNKSQVSNNNMPKTVRDRGEYGGYIITSNTPYNTGCQVASGNTAAMNGNIASGMPTNRRKSTRTASSMKSDKYFTKDDKILNLDDVKKEHSNSNKAKTTRPDKNVYAQAASVFNASNMYDNKNFVNFVDSNSQKDSRNQEHTNHHHHHHSNNHDDDKDDDTEEFFQLIRQTVENAIGKSISDLLNRNFRELSAKVDRFSAELKSTNSLLTKLQTDINNKVVHYGEENSRHFRYLCMKSEYDKMFYQHHTMLASASGSPPSSEPNPPVVHSEKRSTGSKQSTSTNECERGLNSCSCRGNIKTPSSDPHKIPSEDRSMSQKSSKIDMREVLENIERFFTQFQMNQMKCDDQPLPKASSYRLEEAMKITKPVFDEDDDDFQMSSDGMTPRSDEHLHHTKYGGTTMRSCSTTRGGNGGGDA